MSMSTEYCAALSKSFSKVQRKDCLKQRAHVRIWLASDNVTRKQQHRTNLDFSDPHQAQYGNGHPVTTPLHPSYIPADVTRGLQLWGRGCNQATQSASSNHPLLAMILFITPADPLGIRVILTFKLRRALLSTNPANSLYVAARRMGTFLHCT